MSEEIKVTVKQKAYYDALDKNTQSMLPYAEKHAKKAAELLKIKKVEYSTLSDYRLSIQELINFVEMHCDISARHGKYQDPEGVTLKSIGVHTE